MYFLKQVDRTAPTFSEIFGRWSEISFEGLGSFEGRRPRWNDMPTAMAFQSRMIDC